MYTGLHVAVLQEDIIAVEFLLQWFCDVDEKDDDGWTALHHAAAENNVRFVLTLLKRHAKPDIKSNAGKVSIYCVIFTFFFSWRMTVLTDRERLH